MRTTMLPLALIATGCLGVVMVVRLSAWPVVRVTLPRSDSPAMAHVPARSQEIAADSVAAIAARDAFHAGRRPVLPAYDPLRLAEQLAPPPPRPTLVLVGVINGANPSAVIEGFPGVEGSRVVRLNDIVAGFTIKKVGAGRVVVSGMDTTWVLEVREPWKP